jgi:hypothetical protein
MPKYYTAYFKEIKEFRSYGKLLTTGTSGRFRQLKCPDGFFNRLDGPYGEDNGFEYRDLTKSWDIFWKENSNSLSVDTYHLVVYKWLRIARENV